MTVTAERPIRDRSRPPTWHKRPARPRVMLRLEGWDELRKAKGLLKDTELCDELGYTPLSWYRLMTRRMRPGNDFIAAALYTFPGSTFADLFEVVMEVNGTGPTYDRGPAFARAQAAK
jgi:hypothetical protein